MEATIQLLSTSLLQPNPFQPRGFFDKKSLQELADSIKTHGILEPLIVAHTPAGYQIIAGERRWRASQLIGLVEVPVIIKKTTPRGMLEMALIENVQRVDLSSIERAKAFLQLAREFGYSHAEIAKRINKSTSFVSNTVRLLNLPDAIKDGLIGNLISEGHARAISGIPNQQDMVNIYKQILRENASVRRAEELSRKYRHGGPGASSRARKKAYAVIDERVTSWNEHLSKMLKTEPEIKLTRSIRQTRITITLKGGLEKTQRDLEKIIELTQ